MRTIDEQLRFAITNKRLVKLSYSGSLRYLEPHDYGVQKGFAKTFRKRKLPTPKELMKHGEKWRPYRSLAAWYFWRALD